MRCATYPARKLSHLGERSETRENVRTRVAEERNHLWWTQKAAARLGWQFLSFAESRGSRMELKIYEWSLQALLSLPAPPAPPAFASTLARLFFTIPRNGELACRVNATCRHIQYSDAIRITKVTKDFLYLFICYGYVRLSPFPSINSLFRFQSVTVRDVNFLPFSLLIASPGNVVWKE